MIDARFQYDDVSTPRRWSPSVRGTSRYAAAAVWTAAEESIVSIVPSTAVAAAWADLAEEHRPVLDVLLHLPVTVIDNLDESRAKTVGQLGGAQADDQTAHQGGVVPPTGWRAAVIWLWSAFSAAT